MNSYRRPIVTTAIAVASFVGFGVLPAHAHCDTLDGPVVADARAALAGGTIEPVLKWVRVQDEAALKQAFDHVIEVRELNDNARELADMYFFETLVRIHREGEGAPYTGLKPEGSDVEPGIALADEAIASGQEDELVEHVKQAVDEGLRHRFEKVQEKLKDVDTSVDAGRAYVAAYVDFIHYAEGLVQAAKGGAAHHAAGADVAEHDSHTAGHGGSAAPERHRQANGHTHAGS